RNAVIHDGTTIVPPLLFAFESFSNIKESRLARVRRKELESHRKIDAVTRYGAARYRESGDAGQVRGYGEDVFEVHRERVALFADLKSGCWRGGCCDKINILKCFFQFFAHKRAHMLRLPVVRIV